MHDRITEIQIFFTQPTPDPRLKGFIRLIFDDSFLLGDLKIIEKQTEYGNRIFLAMPSRNTDYLCTQCKQRTPNRGLFCMGCGKPIQRQSDRSEELKNHVDVFHPLSFQARRRFESFILGKVFEFRDRSTWSFQKWYVIR